MKKEKQFYLIMDSLSENENIRMEVLTAKDLKKLEANQEDLDEVLGIDNWETFFQIPNTPENRTVLRELLDTMSQEANKIQKSTKKRKPTPKDRTTLRQQR